MLFRIIAFVSLLGMLGRLTYLHFLRKLTTSGITVEKNLFRGYISWLGRQASERFRPSSWRPLFLSLLKKWSELYPSLWLRWTVAGLVLSFCYLAASGFVFALFTSRGIFGLPLFLHVIAGGIFAVCLTVVLFFRAKDYAFLGLKKGFPATEPGTLRTAFSRLPLQMILFWLFVISGLFLTATSLISMLPYFSYKTQLGLIETHRYSALVSLITAIIFFDTIVPLKHK
jgi:hypothetical protein